MEIRIDKAGRIVVPKPLRERMGFRPDTELEAIEQPEGVLLKRIEHGPSMVQVDDLSVKNPDGGEEVKHHSPQVILDQIAALDLETAEVLKTIRGLL
jgi:AbrB family looped-hinge helix DNA binding protein